MEEEGTGRLDGLTGEAVDDDDVSPLLVKQGDKTELRESNHEDEPNQGQEEEQEDMVEEDEDDEEEDDGVYVLGLDGEIDPSAFTEDDVSDAQPHMPLDYEALAARKRKALQINSNQREMPNKKSRQVEALGVDIEELMEVINQGLYRKSRKKAKKRGRPKGSKKKGSPEITRKLGDATLHYALGRYKEAISLLKEVIRLSPDPDPYHTLGLAYDAIGYKTSALNCYFIAARASPKDTTLWKLLFTRCLEQGYTSQAWYCLSKAITADPEDLSLRNHRASLYVEIGDYQKAAKTYEQFLRICPENIEALKTSAMLNQKCGRHEHSVSILEDYLRNHLSEVDSSVVDLLASICIEGKLYMKALHHIERAQQVYYSGKELPLCLTIKAGICHLHLGDMEKAEGIFSILQQEKQENVQVRRDLIIEVADLFMRLEHFESALKYYMILEENGDDNKGLLYVKIAQCYLLRKERVKATEYFYKALHKLDDTVDARLSLASLLLEEDRSNEAILVLSPPTNSEMTCDPNSDEPKPWWLNGKIKLKLSQIYKAKGALEAFVDVLSPLVRESLHLEVIQQQVKVRKRLPIRVLSDRVKLLDDNQTNLIFHGFRPVASASELLKATRARKQLQKKEELKNEKRAAALAAGADWKSDDSDDEAPIRYECRELPLPNLLKDEEHQCLIIDLCKALSSLQKYGEALEIINLSLKVARHTLPVEKKEVLQSIGARIAYSNPTHGLNYAHNIVMQHPYSFTAWNYYYKVMSRLDNHYSKHNKFLHRMRVKYKDCVPKSIIFGNQYTMISQHQVAAKEYLEAYKLMPDNPFINLCAGTALINLALGLRLQNKHHCVVQGLAFLYNNVQNCQNKQEALYNLARAYHHVGLVSLAAATYEKVLAIHQDDFPIPNLPNENFDPVSTTPLKPGYCDLRREAAYNLHFIYRESGAFDLARQILKDYCSF